MPQPRPVQVTMQAVPQGGAPPLPLRWAEAVRNVVEAQAGLEGLAAQLDGALFLDDEAWQQAVPHAQYTAALQGQQRRIRELEARVGALAVRLEESERARGAAEERVRQLGGEVESSASVFKLHYDELMRKDREIQELRAMVEALSLGGGVGGGSDAGGGGEGGGSESGGSEGGGSEARGSCMDGVP